MNAFERLRLLGDHRVVGRRLSICEKAFDLIEVEPLGQLRPTEREEKREQTLIARAQAEEPGIEVGIEQERHQQLERLRLTGAVRALEDQPTALETELLLGVVPDVDDAGADRLPALPGR